MPHRDALEITQRITVLQGEVKVSADPAVEFTTVLGSCVTTCLFDPQARIGGMNHFLLAEPPSHHSSTAFDVHYGVYLMELLINEMLAGGARKDRLKGRLYGGANLHTGMQQIGTVNASFARNFLLKEGIPLMHEELGGTSARRVHFLPASGRVRCRTSDTQIASAIVQTRRPASATGEVELF
jgi:chemotaxis protein CheD